MRRLVLLITLIVLAASPPARADTRKESYVAGPAGDGDGVCRFDTPNPSVAPNVGTVCFISISGFASVKLTVTDAGLWRVAYWAGFVNAAGTSLGGRWYCGGSPTIARPSGGAKMYVYIAGARGPIEGCLDDVGIGTNGTVTGVFT